MIWCKTSSAAPRSGVRVGRLLACRPGNRERLTPRFPRRSRPLTSSGQSSNRSWLQIKEHSLQPSVFCLLYLIWLFFPVAHNCPDSSPWPLGDPARQG